MISNYIIHFSTLSNAEKSRELLIIFASILVFSLLFGLFKLLKFIFIDRKKSAY